MFANKFATGSRSQNIEAGIKEKNHMEKDLKYFFPEKRFWHSISKQLRSTNSITK